MGQQDLDDMIQCHFLLGDGNSGGGEKYEMKAKEAVNVFFVERKAPSRSSRGEWIEPHHVFMSFGADVDSEL